MPEQSWDTEAQLLAAMATAAKKGKNNNWGESARIQEIRGGAIIPSRRVGEYEIQAITAGGLRNFRACESSDLDAQSDDELTAIGIPYLTAMALRDVLGQWITVTVKTTTVNVKQRPHRTVANPATSEAQTSTQSGDELTPDAVFRLLEDDATSGSDAQKAILQAEVIDFGGDERARLCTLLRRFVMRHRDSNELQDLVAVGAAIRKLVAYLPTEDLGTLNDILIPSSRMAIPLEIELEVAKTVLRKLTWRPPLIDNAEPRLGDALMDIATTYVNPRLLPREKCGATALNAVLSLLLLRSSHVPRVISRVADVSVNWFTQLACRRIERLQIELRRRVSLDAYPAVTRSLVEFTTRFRPEGE